MNNLSTYVEVFFTAITLVTLAFCFFIIRNAKLGDHRHHAITVLAAIMIWLTLQGFLSFMGVYSTDLDLLPPKIVAFGILPAVVGILIAFNTRNGRAIIDTLPLINLTYIHVVRLPVELVLYWLFLRGSIPVLMTFNGLNFDIVIGISAPFIAYFANGRPKVLLWWNFVSLLFLANIVLIALLSAPTPLQQLAFNQPNIAVLYFPFSWLPTFIVPVILFSHLASIRILLKSKNYSKITNKL